MVKLESPTVYGLTDFVDLDLGDEPFLVAPILPRGGICVIHGKRNHGKTPLSFSLMLAVANGGDFLGTYASARGRVAYIQADMPLGEQQSRLRRIVRRFEHPEDVLIVPCPKPFDIGLELNKPWLKEVRAFEPDLVIVDSLRKTHKRAEDSSEVPSAVYAWWKEAVGLTTFCFLHHDRKTQIHKKDEEPGDPNESFRGSTAWLDDADTGIKITKHRGQFRVYWTKLRTCAEQPSVEVVLDPESLLVGPVMDARMRATVLLRNYPEKSNKKLAEVIVEEKLCVRSTAMEILAKLRGGRGSDKGGPEGSPTSVSSDPPKALCENAFGGGSG